jgi:hypothetical protein
MADYKSYYYPISVIVNNNKFSENQIGNIIENGQNFTNKFEVVSLVGSTIKNASITVSKQIPGLNISVNPTIVNDYVKADITVTGKTLLDKNNFGEIKLILTVDSTTTTRGPGETTTTRGPGETTTTRGPTGQTTTTRGPTSTTTRRPTTPPPTTLQPPVTTTRTPRTTTTVTTTSVTTTVTTTVTTAPPTTQAPCPPCDS